MSSLKKLFGTNLRRLRRQQGLSQEDLAETLGVTSHSVSNIERGIHAPRFTTLELLADILATPPADFFRKPVTPPVPRKAGAAASTAGIAKDVAATTGNRPVQVSHKP